MPQASYAPFLMDGEELQHLAALQETALALGGKVSLGLTDTERAANRKQYDITEQAFTTAASLLGLQNVGLVTSGTYHLVLRVLAESESHRRLENTLKLSRVKMATLSYHDLITLFIDMLESVTCWEQDKGLQDLLSQKTQVVPYTHFPSEH
jgi:hypothetical protein